MSEEKDLEEISEEEQYQILAEQLAAGDKTVNEVRGELDLPPVPHGDVTMNPGGLRKHEAVSALKKAAIKPPQMITFDRYFMSLGRPMHHKAGMAAFCSTKGKKTREAWETLFAKY